MKELDDNLLRKTVIHNINKEVCPNFNVEGISWDKDPANLWLEREIMQAEIDKKAVKVKTLMKN